jgi:hypothetical protein
MNIRRLTLAAMCVLAGGLALASAPALAGKIYYPGPSFGEPGAGTGQFDEPVGVAVNDSTDPMVEPAAGDVYVVDEGNGRVERLSATGEYKGQFDGSGEFEVEGKKEKGKVPLTGKFSAPEQVAVDDSGNPLDPSAGDVYVTDTGHKAIDQFSAAGEYLGQLTETKGCENERKELTTTAPPCSVGEEPVTIPFNELRNVAVDSSGDLWVLEEKLEHPREEGYVDEFSDTGAFLRRFWTHSEQADNHGFAVDSHEDIYVGTNEARNVRKYTATGDPLSKTVAELISSGATALALVPSTSDLLANELLVDRGGSIGRYGPFGEPYGAAALEGFPGESVPVGFEGFSRSEGVAVNTSATVYASERVADKVQSFDYVTVPEVTTEAPSGVTETGMTLHGSVNPEGEEVKGCSFEYGIEAGRYTNKVACEQNPSKKNGPVTVSAVVSGLEPASVRSFRLVAESAADIPRQGQGLTVNRPVAADEAISDVGLATATAGAQVDAGGLASSTCYWIEYGPSAAYGSSTPVECDVAGLEEVAVSVELPGLQPDTQYHFRVAASNALGASFGGDVAFTTFAPSVAEPPDGRVYEAVSAIGAGRDTDVYVPTGMEGALDGETRHGIPTGHPFQAAGDGEAVAYLGDPPAKGGNGNIGESGGNEYVARRIPGGGWTQVNVNASSYENNYEGFSGELSIGVLESPEQLAEDAPKGYSNLYRRLIAWGQAAGGSLEPLLGPFEPLFTATPPCIATEFGAVLNGKHTPEPLFGGGNAGTGAVAAFSHLLFEANAALPSTPAASEDGCGAGNDLYDSVGGQLYLVNVLPGGGVAPDANFGRQGPSTAGFYSPETSNAISADGSRIYWSAVKAVEVGGGGEYEEQPQVLYVRENDTQPEGEGGECAGPGVACTVQVDAAEAKCGSSCKGGGGRFWTASGDGSEVFFTDERALTERSGAGPNEPDLYEYDLEAPEGERLSDLSLPVEPGGHANVQGVLGTSEDGSYVYFVADGALTEGENAEGEKPAEEKPNLSNLYVRHGGVTTFIATLSSEDDDFTQGSGGSDGDWQADPGHRTAEVAPDGHSVVFMSRRPLTGYDSELEGTPMTEVFVYDTETERLVCASCNPSGEPPVVPAEFANSIGGIWGAFLPVSDSEADYQPRVISEDGDRVFFNSIEPLVPQDTNGLLGVYEWERDGTGSCREARGCVFLLSTGTTTDNSYLIDASASGDDVFFVSRAQLVKADRGGDDDVLYDARVGGAPPSEEACAGTGCQGVPPAPPIFATPASVTFEGAGNPPPPPPTPVCKKDKKLSHGKCVKVKVKGAKGKRKAKAKKSARRGKRAGRGGR